jgi:hypothetical protein
VNVLQSDERLLTAEDGLFYLASLALERTYDETIGNQSKALKMITITIMRWRWGSDL